MGAISDGSAKIYTRDADNKPIDIARENRIRGNASHTWGVALAQGVPSLFMCLGSKIGEGSDKSSDNDTENNDAKIAELKKELDGYLAAMDIKEPRKINETVTAAQNEYQDSKVRLDNAQKSLDDYINLYKEKPVEERPTDYDEKVSELNSKVQEAQEAEKTAKAKLDKVTENAKKAYECVQKLIDLRQAVEVTDYIEESKETLRTFNDARAEFISATTDDAKKAAAKKLYDIQSQLKSGDSSSSTATINKTITILEEKYKLAQYKETPTS